MGTSGADTSGQWTNRGVLRRTIVLMMTFTLAFGSASVSGPLAVPGLELRSPVGGDAVPVTGFDPPEEPWLPGHRGVDLASVPLAPVLAPGTATVLFAGSVGGKPVVSLDHGAGLRTTYEPVAATVRAGESVAMGEPVGHLVAGHPGCPVAACLHWGARVASGGHGGDDDEYIDPMTLLLRSDRPIRLKSTLPGDGER